MSGKIFGRETQILADVEILLARLTALRAGYLDELDFDLAAPIAAIPTTMRGTDLALPATKYVTERGTNNALLASNYRSGVRMVCENTDFFAKNIEIQQQEVKEWIPGKPRSWDRFG